MFRQITGIMKRLYHRPLWGVTQTPQPCTTHTLTRSATDLRQLQKDQSCSVAWRGLSQQALTCYNVTGTLSRCLATVRLPLTFVVVLSEGITELGLIKMSVLPLLVSFYTQFCLVTSFVILSLLCYYHFLQPYGRYKRMRTKHEVLYRTFLFQILDEVVELAASPGPRSCQSAQAASCLHSELSYNWTVLSPQCHLWHDDNTLCLNILQHGNIGYDEALIKLFSLL